MHLVTETEKPDQMPSRTPAATPDAPAELAVLLRQSPVIGVRRFLKRCLDLGVAFFLLFLLSPVIALLALLIKLQDGGPAFYRRRVVGPQGEFDAFKLRTMRVDADHVLNGNLALQREFEIKFKLQDDPRVTRIGAVLRRSSLDELPQLWNVLSGQMSLVGPRMITPAELKKYGDASRMFDVIKPGITGYWQIQGRQQVSYEERVKMDLFYVSHWSLWLDFAILVKTPIRVLRGAGAF
jgi:lipopolysaccharide/colanic/teichoic acid biosynthesis glycosyltransferase